MSEEVRMEAPGVPRARMMLQRAHWAASAMASVSSSRSGVSSSATVGARMRSSPACTGRIS